MSGGMMPGAAAGAEGAESGSMGGYPGGMMMGGYSGSGMMSAAAGPGDAKIDLYRRRLKADLDAIRRGILGMAKMAPADPAKKTVADLSKKIGEVLTATDPPDDKKAGTPASTPGGMPSGYGPMGGGMMPPGLASGGMTGIGGKKVFTVKQMTDAIEKALIPLEEVTKGVNMPAPPTVSSEPAPEPAATPAPGAAPPAAPAAPAGTPPAAPAPTPPAAPAATPPAATPAPAPAAPAATPPAAPATPPAAPAEPKP